MTASKMSGGGMSFSDEVRKDPLLVSSSKDFAESRHKSQNVLVTTRQVVSTHFANQQTGFVAANLSSKSWRSSLLLINALLMSKNTTLKTLHPLSRCAFIGHVKGETASRAQRLALYDNKC